MANHVSLDQTKALGNQFRQAAAMARDLRNFLRDLKGSSAQFLTGDGSQDAHYAGFVTAGVGATTTEAHNGFAQLDNLITALLNNASQTAVADKFEQFVTYLGGN